MRLIYNVKSNEENREEKLTLVCIWFQFLCIIVTLIHMRHFYELHCRLTIICLIVQIDIYLLYLELDSPSSPSSASSTSSTPPFADTLSSPSSSSSVISKSRSLLDDDDALDFLSP